MKTFGLGQCTSIKEDMAYPENGRDKTILQPGVRRFLKQVFEKAEIKPARRKEQCRTFGGFYEKTRISDKELRDERTV
jgi:hypothetical protein